MRRPVSQPHRGAIRGTLVPWSATALPYDCRMVLTLQITMQGKHLGAHGRLENSKTRRYLSNFRRTFLSRPQRIGNAWCRTRGRPPVQNARILQKNHELYENPRSPVLLCAPRIDGYLGVPVREFFLLKARRRSC
jgi:hypothetical protein